MRAQGKVAGAHQEFCGPMAKQQRMATVTIAAIACAVIPGASDWQIPMLALWVIIAGCIVTIIRRLQRIVTTLRG
jgi:phosphatidylglycerophosphate synthase